MPQSARGAGLEDMERHSRRAAAGEVAGRQDSNMSYSSRKPPAGDGVMVRLGDDVMVK